MIQVNVAFCGHSKINRTEDFAKWLDMTVLYVSHVLGVSPQAVYQWESGETAPTTQNLIKMKELYRCTADELLPGWEE